MPRPKPLPMSPIRVAPKRTTTIARIMSNSGAPKLWNTSITSPQCEEYHCLSFLTTNYGRRYSPPLFQLRTSGLERLRSRRYSQERAPRDRLQGRISQPQPRSSSMSRRVSARLRCRAASAAERGRLGHRLLRGRLPASREAAERVGRLVGVGGFEPPASWPQTRRSSLAELHPAIVAGSTARR